MIAILVINNDGIKIAKLLRESMEDSTVIHFKKARESSLNALVSSIFNEYKGVVFIAAMGIVVRSIAPFIRDKYHDPAVVCVDTAGRFAISVLSGHEGGANTLAFSVAESLGALPVITTGTESHKKFILGIGSRRGISKDTARRAIMSALNEKNIKLKDVRVAATIDIKKNENGLRKACSELGLPMVFFSAEDIKNFTGAVSESKIVKRHLGLKGVCEPCALLAGRRPQLILTKRITDGVTVAIARES